MSGGHGHGADHGGGHGHEEHEEEEHEEHEEEHHEEHEEHDGHAGHEDHQAAHHEKLAPNEEKKPPKPRKKIIGESQILLLLAVAIFGRILTNELEFWSVEPIIPIAVYAGLAYGVDAGIFIGLLAYPLSNIFLQGGPFGLWSFLQGAAGAIAGGLAGSVNAPKKGDLLKYTVIGTVIFEVILNLSDGQILVFPFSFTHIITNAVFALVIAEFVWKEK